MNRRSIVSAAATVGVIAAAVAVAGPASAGLLAGNCTTAQAGNASVQAFGIPNLGSNPFLITSRGTGAAGSLVFSARGGNSVQSYTPATNAFSVLASTNVQAPQGVAVASDGSVWFTNSGPNTIGKIEPSGAVTSFAIPTAGSNPWGIVQGPDGNMWFTEYNTGKIGRITMAGVITEYTQPISTPLQITVGPDGRMWFSAFQGSQIGAIDTNGNWQVYALPKAGTSLNGIGTGSDGNVWFLDAQYGNPGVGMISATGQSITYPIGMANAQPAQIAAGPAGGNAQWFTQGNGNIGKVTTSGVVTSYPATSSQANPNGIVTGPDGNLWFTEAGCGALGTIDTSPSVYGVMTARPSTARRGKTYTVKVKMSAKGKVSLGIIGNGKRRTLLNTTGKKGVTTIRMTIPSNLQSSFRGKVTLVLNAAPGKSANKAAQTAPITIR